VTSPKTRPDIGFIPTPDDAIAAMLKLAELTPDDHVYDLGCGDGRLVIKAVLDYGVTAVGVDVDENILATARLNAQSAGVSQQLTFLRDDLFECDVREATVVFIYLLPHLNMRLRPRLLQQLRSGARVISHQFDMGNWSPDLTLRLEPSEEDSILHLWRIPDVIPPELTTNT
jgi:ribosomal protein L11 methylase PrmA